MKKFRGGQVKVFVNGREVFGLSGSKMTVHIYDKPEFVEDEPQLDQPAFPKPKRKKKVSSRDRRSDESILELVRGSNCLACEKGKQFGPCDPDHIITVGAGGGDTLENVWPLCRKHHIERHARGLFYMASHYSRCYDWLEKNGHIERIIDRSFK